MRNAPNRDDRKKVFDGFLASYKAFENSLGASLRRRSRAIFPRQGAQVRRRSQAALDGPNIPEAVYRTLIAETNRGLPVLHRYLEVRQKMLGLPDIGY